MTHHTDNGNMHQDTKAAQEHARIAAGAAKAGTREGAREGSYADRSGTPSSDEIRRDIGRTRTELDQTLLELESRLRPEAIVDRVVDQAMLWVDRGVARVKTSGGPNRLAAVGRSRAVPLTLLGLGAGWLAAEMLSEKRGVRRGRGGADVDDIEGGSYAVSGDYDRAKPPGHSVRDDEHPDEDIDIRPVYSGSTGAKLGYEQTVPGGTSGVSGPAPIGPGGPGGPGGGGDGISTRRGVAGYGRDDIDEAQRPDLSSGGPRDAGNRPRGLPYDYSGIEEGRALPARASNVGEPEIGPRSGVRSRIGSAGARAGGMASGFAGQARGMAGDVRHRASSAWDSASDVTSRAAHGIRDNAAAAADSVAHGSRAAYDAACDTYDRHPLALGAIAFGVGLLAAVAIPSSRREDRWFGEESDDLYRQAKRAASETVHRGRQVAEHVGEAALEGAGIDHLQSRREVMSAARRAADEAMKAAGVGHLHSPEDVIHAAREAAEAASHAATEEIKSGLREGADKAGEQIDRQADRVAKAEHEHRDDASQHEDQNEGQDEGNPHGQP